MLPAALIAKEVVKTSGKALNAGGEAISANRTARNEADAQLFEGMSPEAVQEVQRGRTHRVAIVAGATVLSVVAAGVGVKIFFDDAWNKGIQAIETFAHLAPKGVGVTDVNNLIGDLKLPHDYDLIKGNGQSAAEAKSKEHTGPITWIGTGKDTYVKSAVDYSVAIPRSSLAISATEVPVTKEVTDSKGQTTTKTVEEMRLLATFTFNKQELPVVTADANGAQSPAPVEPVVTSNFDYKADSAKTLDSKATEGVVLRGKNVVTGSDEARRLKDLGNYGIANWANSCSPILNEVLSPAISESVHDAVETALTIDRNIDQNSKIVSVLQAALDRKILVSYVDYNGNQVTPSTVQLPLHDVVSKKQLADGLGVDKDELTLTADDCDLSKSSTPELVEIVKNDPSELMPIIHNQRGSN